MKKTVLGTVLLAAVLVAAPEYSAATKGSFLLGGTFSIRATANAPLQWASNSVYGDPYGLYYITQGLGLGAGFSVGMFDHEDAVSEWGLGPKLEYYFGMPDRKSHPFLGLGLGVRSRRALSETWTGAGLEGSFGVANMIGDKFATLSRVSYLWEVLARGERVRADGVFSISVGVVAWLRRVEDLR